MKEKLYIVGKKVAGGYPDGRYVCSKVRGKVHDHYIVKAVIDYPSVRAVANEDAWSNAEVYPYCRIVSVIRSEMMRELEVYEGNVGTEEDDYNLSLMMALEIAIEEYTAKGDMEAVDRLRGKLRAAAQKCKT